MKHLNQFITEYIVKKKLDKAIDSEDHYKYFPETKDELIDNIKELFYKGETDLNCINTSAITDMSHLFEICKNSLDFDVSGWDVSNVENMEYMFESCKNFNCDLSNWDVSNVTNMICAFCGCSNFTGKGLENWNVSNVKDMCNMFMFCRNFDCDLSRWNVSNVTNMRKMFDICENFKGKGL